jgi:uncharacterized RDD family membrane protein YckC
LSKSASLPLEPFDDPQQTTAAWKQEVNQRLAAHRNRRSSQDYSSTSDSQSARPSNGRAAEAAARVAARYAKAPSYSEVLAGEARAAVRAAAEAAEAALNAHAAAQAVLDGLENRPLPPHLWQPVEHAPELEPEARFESRLEAHPVFETHTDLEAHLEQQPAPSRWLDEPPAPPAAVQPPPQAAHPQPTPSQPARPWPGAQPRWEVGLQPPVPEDIWDQMRVHPAPEPQRSAAEPRIYRRSRPSEPVVEDLFEEGELFEIESHTVEPVQVSHANLIEFPRELVATRKARPRLAEGPLYDQAHANEQLNIFEVDPEEISAEPVLSVAPPGWASIELDHHAAPAYHELEHTEQMHSYAHSPELLQSAYATPAQQEYAASDYAQAYANPEAYAPTAPPQPAAQPVVRESAVRSVDAPPEMLVATFGDRVLAGIVDSALVTIAFLAAAVVVIASTSHPPAGRLALLASGCALVLFGILYQFLFLSYTEEGTPGMRYARIALCTFDDENPTIEQMRLRIPALLLSAFPAGLGLLWSLWDKDHLGWHDRWTRTYQRKY